LLISGHAACSYPFFLAYLLVNSSFTAPGFRGRHGGHLDTLYTDISPPRALISSFPRVFQHNRVPFSLSGDHLVTQGHTPHSFPVLVLSVVRVPLSFTHFLLFLTRVKRYHNPFSLHPPRDVINGYLFLSPPSLCFRSLQSLSSLCITWSFRSIGPLFRFPPPYPIQIPQLCFSN